jgi:small-conductance mechanosensitive channel
MIETTELLNHLSPKENVDSWPSTLLYSIPMMITAWVLTRIGLAIAAHWSKGRKPFSSRVISQVRHPALLLLPLIALHAVLHAAEDTVPFIKAARQTNLVFLILSCTWLVASIIGGFADGLLSQYTIGGIEDLSARRMYTQTRVLSRSMRTLVYIIGLGAVLMSFPNVRQIGASLLASAGVAGLIAGIAARPVIGNFIAGLQIGLSQPIRIDDVLVINGEWGKVEEISNSFVVLKIWDERRLVIPLQWFIENPFQNWTRHNGELTGTIFLWVDYRMPLEPLRQHAFKLCEARPEWDKRLCLLQVTDTTDKAVQLRVLVTSPNASACWDLRCFVREGLVDLMQREYPEFLPRLRTDAPPVKSPLDHAMHAHDPMN